MRPGPAELSVLSAMAHAVLAFALPGALLEFLPLGEGLSSVMPSVEVHRT